MIESGEEPAAYLFHLHELIDVKDLDTSGENAVKEAINKMGLSLISKIPILEKLKTLSATACLVLIVRHRELTRGGEYIELTFLLHVGTQPEKIKFLWNKRIPLSTMMNELLAMYGFTIHTYTNEKSLMEQIHRIIYYNCLSR